MKATGIILRDYQENAVNDLRRSYAKGKKAPLLVSPTGSGKTVIFAEIVRGAYQKNKRVFIVAHRAELINQISSKLREVGVDHGIVKAGYTPAYYKSIQVCSIQSLSRRLNDIIPPDLVVLDEAHHAVSASWRNLLRRYHFAKVLGVTATPERTDGTGLGTVFDDMILGPSVLDLISKGHLARPEVYAPPTAIDLSRVKVVAGDYEKGQLTSEMNKSVITGCAVEHYTKYAYKKKAIIFCVSVQHAKDVAEQFRNAGYEFYSIDGSMDDVSRAALISALTKGTIDGLVSCDLISEGTDIPRVEVGIFLRPTQSMSLWLQQAGRCLRPFPGKESALLFDHVGNCEKHGLPNEDREWSLESKPKKKRKNEKPAVPMRMCDKCYFMHPPAPCCPKCGNVYIIEGRKIEVEEGELVKVEKIDRKKQQASAQTLEDLKALERVRGYKKGWAEHIWRARNAKRNGYNETNTARSKQERLPLMAQ